MMMKHDGFTSYGTIGHQSLNLMSQAWATMEHCFSVAAPGHNDKYTSAQGTKPIEGPRYALHLLNKTPVDLLIIETGAKALEKESGAAMGSSRSQDETRQPSAICT
jgi:hypothetical protein